MKWTDEYKKEYARRYREANKDKQKEKHREWRAKNREYLNAMSRKNYDLNREEWNKVKCASAKRRRHAMTPEEKAAMYARHKVHRLKRQYNLTPEQWQAMFESQNNSCAICETVEAGTRGWATDHCHASGKVRGILCQACNKALGYVKDSPDVLSKMISYLAKD